MSLGSAEPEGLAFRHRVEGPERGSSWSEDGMTSPSDDQCRRRHLERSKMTTLGVEEVALKAEVELQHRITKVDDLV